MKPSSIMKWIIAGTFSCISITIWAGNGSVGSALAFKSKSKSKCHVVVGQTVIANVCENDERQIFPTKEELNQWAPYPPNCGINQPDACLAKLCVENPKAYVSISRSVFYSSNAFYRKYCRYCGQDPACHRPKGYVIPANPGDPGDPWGVDWLKK